MSPLVFYSVIPKWDSPFLVHLQGLEPCDLSRTHVIKSQLLEEKRKSHLSLMVHLQGFRPPTRAESGLYHKLHCTRFAKGRALGGVHHRKDPL